MELDTNKVENPLLKRINKIPGETIRLPSKGKLYNNGELDSDVIDGEIVLHPMTTVDEIMMKTPDMLFQGTAIDKVLKRCAPQIKRPLDLLTSDIDYILTYLRKISYGNIIPITWACDATEDAKSREYQIPLDYFITNTKEIEGDSDTLFSVTLSNDQVVRLKPATFREYLAVQQTPDNAVTTPEQFEEYIISSISMIIRDVDGISDKENIKEWLSMLPRSLMEEIEDIIPAINDWGTVFKYTITCKDCKGKHELTTPLNPIAFFMQPSSRKTKKK